MYWQHLLMQKTLSRWAGKLARVKTPAIKNFLIERFIQRYGVNMDEALQSDYTKFPDFNAFFTRALKPEVRPLGEAITSPVDGSICEIGHMDKDQIFQAKGKYYSLNDLLTEPGHAFEDGNFVTIYLAPKDYHCIHLPMDGVLERVVYVPGRLFSVNPGSVKTIKQLFCRNERVICWFKTAMGPMAIVFVGAMLVGQIALQEFGEITSSFDLSEDQQRHYKKGDRLGCFQMGSTVIVLFPKHQINWSSSLGANSVLRYGETMATSF